MISVRRPAFIARSTLPDRWQTISRWPHHLSCSCRVQKDRDEGIYFFFFFSSLFPSTSLISLSRHGGAERQKTATWLSMAPARSASRPKANEEWGAGAWGGGQMNKKGIYSKNLHLSCFCIKKQTWQEMGIQYYGQAAHQMGVGFISVAHPPSPQLPSIHPSLPPSHPLPPLLFASYPRHVSFSLTGQLHQKCPKELGILLWTERNSSFKLFDWFSRCLLFCFFSYSSSYSLHLFIYLFIFFFFYWAHYLQYGAQDENTHTHKYTELNSISASDGHFWQNTKCIS